MLVCIQTLETEGYRLGTHTHNGTPIHHPSRKCGCCGKVREILGGVTKKKYSQKLGCIVSVFTCKDCRK